ncbi:hypothetical protein DT037_18850 [Pseudomonas fulva]|nr:hypothetical protein [Pseudomonas fulva]
MGIEFDLGYTTGVFAKYWAFCRSGLAGAPDRPRWAAQQPQVSLMGTVNFESLLLIIAASAR